MIKRKPLSSLLLTLCIILIPLIMIYSFYIVFVCILLILLYSKVPIATTKCPRCKKNNYLETPVQYYLCSTCKTALRKDPDGWSYIDPHKFIQKQ
ncbi:MAG TPA: hypothetical protein VJ824_02460 [Bacillota bacterium]|nr:hypothetical protein [Bacillota bacterium]